METITDMKILGISCFYHDSSAAIIIDGKVIAAAQEERFSRIKHDPSFPNESIKYCLKEAQLNIESIDKVVFYEKPLLKFERLVETYLAHSPAGLHSFLKAMPVWLKEKLFQRSILEKNLKAIHKEASLEKESTFQPKISFCEHHLSHAASAFFPSPFSESAVLTMDGVGEWATSTICYGNSSSLKVLVETHFPHSLGLLYSAFTYYCGFKVNSGEYKLMGLAPYGNPRFKNLILDKIVNVKDDGSFRLNLEYFDYPAGLKMTNQLFNALFGAPVRDSESPLSQFHMDLAASIQEVTNEIVIKKAAYAKKLTGSKNLCLAGGVALNCVANGKLNAAGVFENIWVQPASGDAGGSLGAAFYYYYNILENARQNEKSDSMRGAFLGPCFSEQQIEDSLTAQGAIFSKLKFSDLVDRVIDELTRGAAVGWFQGRMEFGPRSLGNRSIIADPRNTEMQKNLNLKIKFRESFRPFAPSVLSERVEEWFDFQGLSPYMLMVGNVKKEKCNFNIEKERLGIDLLNQVRSDIPAVTHVDYSARIQTVSSDTNKRFHQLISKFNESTNCPILVNTSFNVRGEPIVCTPEDAFRCFMGTGLDVLVLENFILFKNQQRQNLFKSYENEFDLD